jgi:hypothetical protein
MTGFAENANLLICPITGSWNQMVDGIMAGHSVTQFIAFAEKMGKNV